ncbi:MAG: winged helix-turn-helix transcriptional regulator [Deltaproteobacteria bacterium]|nr:winged helix-turn-helix transcriptional regulator [Deltaproteobacteria bacterium]
MNHVNPCCSEIIALFDPTLFKALSDPNRVTILASLSITAGEQTVSQVAEQFELNFSVVSRHLKILKDAGILSAKKDGKEVRYRVNYTLLAAALRNMASALDHCCSAGECTGDTHNR